MEQWAVVVVATILTLVATGVSSLRCYQCFINPPSGETYSTTKLCTHFDHSQKFVVDCPYSTMCMKKNFHLDIQNGVRIDGVLRDCAPQKYEYQDYKNSEWYWTYQVLEPYDEGCENLDDKGERAPSTRYCYCRSDLCNSSPSSSEGYTDIMGVIVVFNLMKYINSLR